MTDRFPKQVVGLRPKILRNALALYAVRAHSPRQLEILLAWSGRERDAGVVASQVARTYRDVLFLLLRPARPWPEAIRISSDGDGLEQSGRETLETQLLALRTQGCLGPGEDGIWPMNTVVDSPFAIDLSATCENLHNGLTRMLTTTLATRGTSLLDLLEPREREAFVRHLQEDARSSDKGAWDAYTRATSLVRPRIIAPITLEDGSVRVVLDQGWHHRVPDPLVDLTAITVEPSGRLHAEDIIDHRSLEGAATFRVARRIRDRARLAEFTQQSVAALFERASTFASHDIADLQRTSALSKSAAEAWTDRYVSEMRRNFEMCTCAIIAIAGPTALTIPIGEHNLRHADGHCDIAQRRAQALAAAPAFGSGLVEENERAQRGHRGPLVNAVDEAESLFQAIVKRSKAEPWAVRRLMALGHEEVELLDRVYLALRDFTIRRESARVAERLRLEIVVGLGQAAPALCATNLRELEHTVADFRYVINQGGFKKDERAAMRSCVLGLIGASAARGRWPRGSDDAAGVERDVEMADYFRFLFEAVGLAADPILDREAPWSAIVRTVALMMRGRDLEDVRRWCGRYHALFQGLHLLPRAMSRSGANVKEPPPVFEILPSQTLPNGWRVRQLLEQSELDREGRDLEHCVGTYGTDVARQACAVFALEGPAGERVTVEFERASDKGWALRQARGVRNAVVEPGSPAHEALDHLRDRLVEIEPTLSTETKRRYLDGARNRFIADNRSFVSRVLERYGDDGWLRFRHCLPSSAHGRADTKLREWFVRANKGALS